MSSKFLGKIHAIIRHQIAAFAIVYDYDFTKTVLYNFRGKRFPMETGNFY